MATNLFDLSGRVALITGGNKGLGLAMARGFAQAGAEIIIAARGQEQLADALPMILEGTSQRGVAIPFDASSRASVTGLAQTAIALMGRVDILINNAGMNGPEAIDEVTDAKWDQILEVNLSSIMALSRAVAPGMKARGWGRIIHISSIFGQVSKGKRNAYSATKSALMGLCRASAIDLGPFGVTVNCIAPGPFLTDMPKAILSESEKEAFAEHTCLGRWAEPTELVGPALMLASDAGSYITGTTLFVDGGYCAR
jgi:NAD(P)-dependent dehydrogenase (short-subunit alcohol dehydrogenase family)